MLKLEVVPSLSVILEPHVLHFAVLVFVDHNVVFVQVTHLVCLLNAAGTILSVCTDNRLTPPLAQQDF